jgi:hypothetical protein
MAGSLRFPNTSCITADGIETVSIRGASSMCLKCAVVGMAASFIWFSFTFQSRTLQQLEYEVQVSFFHL